MGALRANIVNNETATPQIYTGNTTKILLSKTVFIFDRTLKAPNKHYVFGTFFLKLDT